MKRIRNSLLLLFVALCVFLATAAYAAETGFIVGQAYIELDGYEGHHLFLVNEATIELAHVIKDKKGEWQEKIYETRCDEKGYYYLSKMSLDGYYRVAKLIQDGGAEIVALVAFPLVGCNPVIPSEGKVEDVVEDVDENEVENEVEIVL